MSARCPRCGGDGMDPEPAPECCGRVTMEGECCGSPDPVPQPCKACGGSGEMGEEQPELL